MKIAILNLIAVAASAAVVPRGTVRTNDKNLRFRDLEQHGKNKGVHHGPRPEAEGVTGAASKTKTKREKNHHKGPRPSPSTTVAPPEDETPVAGGVAGGESVPEETPPVEEEEPKKEKRHHGRAKKHEDKIEEELGGETETDEEQPVAKGAKVKDTRKKGGEAPPAPTPAEDVPVVDEPLPPEPTPAPTMGELTDAPTMVKLDDPVVVTDIPTFSPSQEPTWLDDEPETRDIRLPLCPPPYMTDESVVYVGGDVVEVTSHIFQCHSLYEYYCNISDWDDSLLEENPDAEQMWNDAWTHVGPCTGEINIEDINMVSSVAEIASSNAPTSSVTTSAPTSSVTTSAPTTQSTAEDTQEEWQTHHLSDTSILYYKVNEWEGTLSAEVVHDGESWLAIGFSEDGGMVGSEAVIGTPDDGIVQKYNLSGKSSRTVQPMPSDQQSLIDASIVVDEYGQTILRFTKLLIEDGEIGIGVNEMKFLFACGSSTSLGYHSDRISFDIQL